MPDSSSHGALPFRRTTRFVAVAGWCALIFAASHRPNLRVADDQLLDLILRKGAHVLVFGVLAVLIVRALQAGPRPMAPRCATTWLLTFAYAGFDEWHQTFVVGRVGHASDVAIDMVGATIACALMWRSRHSRRTTTETTA